MKDFLPIGLHENIPASVYHQDPCERPSLSASIAKVVDELSVAHAKAKHPRFADVREGAEEEEEDDDKAGVKTRGTLIHGMLLGGGADFVTVMRRYPEKVNKKTGEVTPEVIEEATSYQSDSAKEHKAAILAAGKLPIIGKKRRTIEEAAEQLRAKVPSSLMNEVTLVWESDGTLCRTRIDGLTIIDEEGRACTPTPMSPTPYRAVIRDLKSCDNAMRASSDANVFKMGHAIQRAANVEAVETLFPALTGRVEFYLDFAEVSRPWDVLLGCDMTGELMELGTRAWKRAKAAWGRAVATGEFPGYETRRRTIGAPPWAVAAELDAQLRAMGGPSDVDF